MLAYYILIPQFLIGIVSWIQLILSMNRYRGAVEFTRTDMWALILYLHSAFVKWIAALSIEGSTLSIQILAAVVGATVSWTSFVLVFNEGFRIPSRQQMWALLMSIIVTGLWEVNNRLVIQL